MLTDPRRLPPGSDDREVVADGTRWFHPPPCRACRRGGADPLCGCTDPIALGPADDDTENANTEGEAA